jgi:CO/xanthine dehydrogenase Mo-binding subunit
VHRLVTAHDVGTIINPLDHQRLFEKSSIGGISSVYWRDGCTTIPYRPH